MPNSNEITFFSFMHNFFFIIYPKKKSMHQTCWSKKCYSKQPESTVTSTPCCVAQSTWALIHKGFSGQTILACPRKKLCNHVSGDAFQLSGLFQSRFAPLGESQKVDLWSHIHRSSWLHTQSISSTTLTYIYIYIIYYIYIYIEITDVSH